MHAATSSLSSLAIVAALASAASLTSTATAQVTTHSLTIGGSGAKGCQHPNQDPPRLEEGTLASADIGLTYDARSHVLTLVVDNTSPVTNRVPNPLITRIALNLPQDAVTGGRLLSQSGSGGATPNFSLEVDPDLQHAPNLKVACFGDFGLLLRVQNIVGGIGNPLADTYAIPRNRVVIGPATFAIELSGPGVDSLSAYSIGVGFSRYAPAYQVNAACKFQGGGHEGEDSGYISSTRENIGCLPSVWLTAPPRIGTTIGICLNGEPDCSGCLLVSLFPGPSMIGPFRLPIGLPLLGEAFVPPLPRNSLICLAFDIPPDPSLVGRSLYLTLATPGAVVDDLVDFSPRVNVTFVE